MHKKAPYPRGFFYSQIIQINKKPPKYIFGGFLFIFSITTEIYLPGRKLRTALPACHISLSRISANSASNFTR